MQDTAQVQQTGECRAVDQLRFQATLLDAVGEAVAAADRAGRVIFWNRQAERVYGWAAEEALGRPLLDLVAPPDSVEALEQVLEGVWCGASCAGELTLLRRDGSTFSAFVSGSPVFDEAGAVVAAVGISNDLSERKRLEQQLHHAQRLEAVGRLAGGIAHDFNNILTGILGYTTFIYDELRPSDPLREDVDEIRKAADRAAGLTRQLLAFSRKQVLQPRVLDLGSVVEGMERMLARVIGEDIALRVEREPDLGRVKADPGQIEQVVLNLVVNARDAMPRGGALTLEVTHAPCPAALGSGQCVMLAVHDTGCGIPQSVLPHIFEPFFTTKDKGRGTGLGLSMVYGIVVQSGGHVEVSSEPGRGTTFRIYFPRVEPGHDEPPAPTPVEVAGHGETILLVEDEQAVRGLAARALRRLGYHVLEAGHGGEALLLCERTEGAIDLLLTDVIMPQMSGRELAERLQRVRPGLRVMYMSGYTDDILTDHGMEASVLFLEKPYTPSQLATRVRQALDQRRER